MSGTIPHPTRPNDWRDYLEKGEEILWYGRPDPKVQISQASVRPMLLGFGPIIFAVVMFRVTGPDISITNAPDWPLFAIMGALVAMGLWLIIGTPFREARKRRHSHYTLSTRRAFIATDDGVRHLASYPIEPDTPLIFKEGARSTIYFARRIIRARDRDSSDTIEPIGFELIREGEKVLALMRDIQAGRFA